MPNLNYDPQNPTDLLGRPISEGDYVAWGTTYGRSPAVAVCKITKIRFFAEQGYGKRVECPQQFATGYTLRLLPIKSTGSVSKNTEYVSGGFKEPDGSISYFRDLGGVKEKTVQLVKNVVKLEAL